MRIWRREKYFVIVFLSGRICLPSTSLPSRTSNAALSVRKVRGKKSILNGSGVHDVGVGTIKIGRKPLRVRSAKRVHQTVAGGGRFANYFCAHVVEASRGLKAKRISIARNPLSCFFPFYANTSHRRRLTRQKPCVTKKNLF